MGDSDSDIAKKESVKKITKSYVKKPEFNKGVFLLVFAVLIASVSFYGGIAYQKGHGSVTTSALNSAGNNNGTGFGGVNGRTGGFSNRVFGQVTAISASSISIQDMRTGTTSTLAITGSTQITDNGQAVSASDIQTGDTVIAAKSSSNSSNASTIAVNPSFGGYGGGSSQAPSSNSSLSPGLSTN